MLLGGGCYGIGAIFPLARALRQAGNRVICAIEASSAYLLYMQKELATVCDQLIIATKDGIRRRARRHSGGVGAGCGPGTGRSVHCHWLHLYDAHGH